MGEALGSAYVLDEPIGRGATGQVWRGRRRDGQPLAFKVLKPELVADPTLVARFLQERALLTQIEHPNVVHVHDLVAEGDRLAIVMDLVAGPDLRKELRRRGTLPPAEALRVVAAVLDGLAAVHGHGIVHRDAKPENVLLDEASQVPQITDFGTARIIAESTLTRHSGVIGTPEYMAPEIADAGEVSAAADVYSAGIILYELVCGVTPFAGGTPVAVLRRHLDTRPGRPAGVDDGLWELISGLLAKDPAARPEASHAARVLSAAAQERVGQPALPPLETPPQVETDALATPTMLGTAAAPSTPRRKRRRVALVALAALLVIAAGAGAAVALSGGSKSQPTGESSPIPQSPAPATTEPGPSQSPSPSASGTLTTMPSYVGTSLSEVTGQLEAQGITPQVIDQVDDTKADGTILKQSPAPGTPLPAKVTLTVARQAVVSYLSAVQAVQGSPNTGTASVDGKPYAHSVSLTVYQVDSGTTPPVAEYDLGRHYRRFRAMLGMADDSQSDAQVLFEVFADGRKVWSGTLSVGKPAAVDVDVTRALRLRLAATTVAGNEDGASNAVFGDARVLGVESEVPSPTPTDVPSDFSTP